MPNSRRLDGTTPKSGEGLHQLARKIRTTGRTRHMVDRVSGPAITVLISIAAMAQALKVWQWRPGDPVDMTHDSVGVLAQIKGSLDHGWNGSNPNLGAPFHQDASWYPQADQLHLFIMTKVIALFSDNPFTVSAIYFFLGFPLAALSMYWLARQRHLGRIGSIVAGVLFSILPGHQMKFGHLYLASYWVVPLGMWLVLRTARGEPLFRMRVAWADQTQRSSAVRLNLTSAFCVVSIGIGGIYYSAFTLLLLAVTLLVRRVAGGDTGSALRGALLPVAIGTVSLAGLMSVSSGQDMSTLVTASNHRGFADSEYLAGKLMDLILPWTHHRVDALQNLTVVYNSRTSATLEQPALGFIAMAGVVALLVIMLSTLVPQRVKPPHPELTILGLLTVVALSFYSIGGLGSFVALFVTPQIRTWSRLFVVIAIFGLLAVGHWVTVVSRKNRILGLVAAAVIITIGVLDQTNPAVAPNYDVIRTQVADLTAFSQRIQAKVEAGCSVFQLPMVPYPENPPVHDMTDYAHFRPYLTPTALRWSYGAIRGTTLADWQLALPQDSTGTLVDDLVSVGFCAVEVDRAGFADQGTTLDANLRSLLGTPISATHDNRLVAWDLAPRRASLTSQIGAKAVKANGDAVLHPVLLYSDNGTFAVEHVGKTAYQWTMPSFEIDVHNFGRTTVDRVRLTFALAAPDSETRRFTIQLPGGNTQEVDVDGGSSKEVQLVVNAAPGRNSVTVTTNGRAVTIGAVDTKIVYGKLIDLRASATDPNVRLGVVQQRIE